MAKILFTAFMADARNKLAGTVFSRNKAGAYMRSKVTPLNPQTSYQVEVRQRLGTLSSSWRLLASYQRTMWDEAAGDYPEKDVFGNNIILSGAQLYVRLNLQRQAADVAGTMDEPPTPVGFPEYTLTGFSASTVIPSLTILATGSVPAGFNAILYATRPTSAGKSFLKNLYRQIGVVASGSPMPTPSAAGILYTNKFGLFSEGQKIGLRLKLVSAISGQAGVASQLEAVAVGI